VNNSTYLTYLEEGRDEYLTALLGAAVHRVVVRRIDIDSRSGLVQDDDHVDVHVTLERVGESSAATRERIVSVADGRVAAEARTVVVHTDASRVASAPWPEAERRALTQALEESAGDRSRDAGGPA
jgi:acyl-CoA thioesterase FadM